MNPNDTKNTVGADISAPPPLWKKILNTVFFHTCAYFTVFTLILLIIQASAGDSNTAYVKPSRFLLVLPFALFIALAAIKVKNPALSKKIDIKLIEKNNNIIFNGFTIESFDKTK